MNRHLYVPDTSSSEDDPAKIGMEIAWIQSLMDGLDPTSNTFEDDKEYYENLCDELAERRDALVESSPIPQFDGPCDDQPTAGPSNGLHEVTINLGHDHEDTGGAGGSETWSTSSLDDFFPAASSPTPAFPTNRKRSLGSMSDRAYPESKRPSVAPTAAGSPTSFDSSELASDDSVVHTRSHQPVSLQKPPFCFSN